MLDRTEDRFRSLAHSMPPSDFGSTRAIQAAASLADDLVKAERARCASIVKAARFGERDCDLRSIILAIENPEPFHA